MFPSTPFLLSSLFLLILYHTTSHLSSGPHIADVNILLPPKMTHPVEYRLQGSDGCFKWSWDHHDILSVLPEYNSSNRCSTSARLKSVAPYGGRKETAVYATDVRTGMVIRCKVYIDMISRIQIFHNSVKLDLDGLATLRARAFDSEENVFSSLVGLQFMWKMMPETDGLHNHLAHVPLKDSPLGDCGGFCGDLDIQVKLEESGVYSDLCVVKGTEIGHEIVSVHLLEPTFEHLGDKIALTVAEAMSLDPPSPVYVLIGAVVPYTLKVIRSNVPHVVSLPSPFHHWSALNSSVAQVERKMGTVHALNLGVTAIVVEDIRVAGHMQISSLHVVLPDNLLLFMSPLSLSGDPIESVNHNPSVARWYVVSGRLYLIQVKVFSPGPGAQEIYTTETDEIELHDNQEEFWDILPVSEGITAKRHSRILRANSYGLGKITATLAYSTGHDMRKEVLKVIQEVMVCDQVKFSMDGDGGVSQRILLPWIPGVYQELELKASGGCVMSSSDYKWFSSDMAVVSVSVSGIVQARKPGKATIRAVSIFDPLNYDEIVIEVSIPSLMVVLPDFPVETTVGSHLQASVTLKASTGAYFYACDAFRSSVRWNTDSESFIIVNTTKEFLVSDKKEAIDIHSSAYGPPCAWTHIYASNSGRTVVHATLPREDQHFDHTSSGSNVLKVSAHIAAYIPLIVHQASDGNQFGGYWFDLAHTESQDQLSNMDYLYLAPGTHSEVMLRGGPERWGQDVDFIETVEVLDEENSNVKGRVSIYQISTSYGNPYRIACESLGTFKLSFRRGNLIGKDHRLPAVAEVQLLLTCSFPSSIVVLADEALNAPQVVQSAAQADRMPGGIRASPITVANGRRIRISAVGISHSGKAFANSSSLSLRWELIECGGLALLDDAYSSSTAKSSWERFLILHNASGLCTVRSTVVGFVSSLSHLDLNRMYEGSMNSITDAIQLQLVSSLRVYPEYSLLFFSPDARLNISITGGTCLLETQVNDTQIVKVIKLPAYQCSQLMLAPKNLGSALVTVHDIGLVPPQAASSTVQVADMDWIKILTGEHISIVEGSLQSINFLVGVGDGRSFDSSQYNYMNIRVHIEESLVEVVDDYNYPILADIYVHAPNFTIQATNLGVTTIYLSAIQHSGQVIRSQPIKVEVYAPPRIHPSDIFLVPGASYVLTVRGGPKIGSHVQYSSIDDQTAEIHKFSGRISAISPGNSTLVATIYGDGDIMLCRAYGKVKVGIPSSAVLNVQSSQLAIGRTVPIYPSLSEGNLFSFYELCNNFKWNIEDKGVLIVQETNNAHGHNSIKTSQSSDSLDEQGHNIIQVLHGVSAGKSNVTVSFSCDFKFSKSSSKSTFYSASLSLWVVSDLPLALGSPITWILPPYHTSSDLLPSKGDSPSDKGVIAYSLLGQCKRKTEEVLDDDVYIDGSKIITKDSGNLACIQAKDTSTGRAEVAACVRVTEVAQIRIMTEEFPVHTLAVGSELDLPIKYHDILGNPFHEAHNISLFKVETNYPDIVSIGPDNGNGKIHLHAKSEGIALLQIAFISNPHKSEYAFISVGPQLYPQNPVLYQGAGVDFNIKGFTDSGSGKWFSANKSVVYVEKLSGKAEAIGEGTTYVHFESSSLKLHTPVTVLKRNIVSVDAPTETLTNVPFPTKGYAFTVKFNHEVSSNKLQFFFECSVEPPNIGFAKPWKDLETGNSFCLFFPYSPEHLERAAPNAGETTHQISVSIRASLVGDDQISGSASALFIGGFSILEMDKDSPHLSLTSNTNKSVITVIGNPDVRINWYDKNRLSVRPIHMGNPKHVKYEVSVYGSERFKDQLIFSLPPTGQRVEMDVSYEPEERKQVLKTYFWAGLFSFLVLSILTLSYMVFYLDRPGQYQPLVSPGTPGVAAPVTPQRSSPALIDDQSPRTPQPFIDYVRRTIDETPYYRQDFRRRVNPQNTF
ncbi:hypothetical protein ACJIZ3_007860 [Penstemon smallii]|uniref:BIG2 domain-containing protein n=1 Tax=Penstemon smallii TaxID=265156 RepID=A0ABD3T850_9LAMI